MNNFKPYKLIVENDFFGQMDVFVESKEDKPREIRLRGPFMMAEKKNLNNRIYRYENLKEQADLFREKWINTKRALGELEHPQYGNINSKEAAQLIVSLEESDDNTWIGESIVLCSDPRHGILGTPTGDITAAIIQRGGKLGQSTRGLGRLSESNVVEDYRLVTVDIVSDPSIGQFTEGILECKNFMIDTHGLIVEMSYDQLDKSLGKLPNKDRKEYMENTIKEFLLSITQKK